MRGARQVTLPAETNERSSEKEFSAHGVSKLASYGLIAIGVLVLGFGGLISLLPMAGAVIAPGEVAVETHVKEVTHPFGGVVAEILVREGDRVRQGQLLVRLDNRVSGAAAELTGLSLDQLLARAARLRATLSSRATVIFPAELIVKSSDPAIATLMDDERQRLALAHDVQADQARQLQVQAAQIRVEMANYASQAAAFRRQEELVHQELAQTRQLYESRLTTLDRLNALERAAVGVGTQKSAAAAGIAGSHARIRELHVQMNLISSSARSEAALELGQVQSQIAQVRKDAITATDQNDRTSIRAPESGIVDKVQFRTIGGVVPAGETLLEIVPDRDRLVVKARIKLTDIDQVGAGQTAYVRFTALNMRSTPEIVGMVTLVAADRTVDRAANAMFYNAIVSISDAEFKKLGSAHVTVGMPVEVFIKTESRTILQYIIRPLSDQFRRALRE